MFSHHISNISQEPQAKVLVKKEDKEGQDVKSGWVVADMSELSLGLCLCLGRITAKKLCLTRFNTIVLNRV